MVSNGEKMHAILLATQEDARISRDIAKASHAVAEEMKQDSVAMKTVLSPQLLSRGENNVTDSFFPTPDRRYDNVLPAWYFFCSKSHGF